MHVDGHHLPNTNSAWKKSWSAVVSPCRTSTSYLAIEVDRDTIYEDHGQRQYRDPHSGRDTVGPEVDDNSRDCGLDGNSDGELVIVVPSKLECLLASFRRLGDVQHTHSKAKSWVNETCGVHWHRSWNRKICGHFPKRIDHTEQVESCNRVCEPC